MRRRGSSGIGRALEAVSAALLGVLLLNAAVELFAWLLWHKSFAALEEIQGILAVWLGLLAAVYCLAERIHLAVDLAERRVPAPLRAALARIPGLASAGFGLLLAGFGAKLVLAVDNTLPGTGWSASLQYQPAVVAGLLMAWIGWRQVRSAPDREETPKALVPGD